MLLSDGLNVFSCDAVNVSVRSVPLSIEDGSMPLSVMIGSVPLDKEPSE